MTSNSDSGGPGGAPGTGNLFAQGRRQARMMRIVNVPMRAVLSLPFSTPLSANLMLVSYTGLKSGKAYLQCRATSASLPIS